MNKPMPTPKQAALAAISALPDETSFEEIAYRLSVLEAIREGMEDIAEERTFSHEEVVADLETWLAR